MNCKQCKIETKDRKGKEFCSRECKSKYKYHNNIEFRNRRIENIKDKRDLAKLTKQKEIIRNILNQVESNNDQTILDLFNKIYNK